MFIFCFFSSEQQLKAPDGFQQQQQPQYPYMPVDPSYFYQFQIAQYYQQQQHMQYYQQYYEQQQQQQQNENLNDIEEDACREDKNFKQIQKLIRNDQPLLTNRSKAHVKAVFCMNKMIKILPNSPIDGQTAMVDVYSLNDLIDYDGDDKNRVLHEFPGPLIK